MKKYFLLLSLFIFLENQKCFSQLSNEQQTRINEAVRNYTSVLETLSSCKGNNVNGLEEDLRELNDGNELNNQVCNDLFYEDPTTSQEPITIGYYLQTLEQTFNNDITVEFDNFIPINCIASNSQYRFALVSAYKTLSYKGQHKEYPTLLSINLDSYKVNQITTPSEYKSDYPQGNNCSSYISDSSTLTLIRQDRIVADNYFSKKDYLNAEKYYSSILKLNLNDLAVQNREEQCKNIISANDLISEAEKEYNKQDYQNALNIYDTIKNNFPQVNIDIQKRIQDCNDAITMRNYNYYIQKGDDGLRFANFESARYNYNQALQYKPNDAYAISKIQQSKLEDRTFARQEIYRAVRLAEASKRNWGEAFRIMTDYEASGLLNAQNYYFLTLMMNDRNNDVKRTMNLNNRGCDYYLLKYSLKLRYALDREPATDVRDKASNLLNTIINARNQRANKHNQNNNL